MRSPAKKIPRSHKNFHEADKNIELEDKETNKILQELQVIEQVQKEKR